MKEAWRSPRSPGNCGWTACGSLPGEERVTRALRELLSDATALVVAHRPSTVTLADTVALLSGGVIAATGSHRHLLATNAEYADLMDVEGLEESA